MGIGNCDLRIDIQQTDHIPEKAAEIEMTMSNDSNISRQTVLTTKSFKVKTADGTSERIKIELGNHSVFPVSYSKGKAPAGADEIALSVINAKEMDKKVGDDITLTTSEGERELAVCGIYSDITNGGKTVKAAFTDPSAEMMWSILYASLKSEAAIHKTAREYADKFKYVKVTDIQEYIMQTYGQTLIAVKQASIAAVAAGISINVLITLLFMKMLMAKDKYSIAVIKSCGFTNSDIRLQYMSRFSTCHAWASF